MAATLDSCKEAEPNPVKAPSSSIDDGCSSRMIPCDDIKNEFLCAICLGILKKTVTSQECLHRFCRVCIQASLKLGNQRCPTCRATLTESNLKADSVFDHLIEKLFPQTENFDEDQLEKNGQSIEVKESLEKQSQDVIFKNKNTGNHQNVPKDGCKGESCIETEDAYCKSCLPNDSNDFNDNRPHFKGPELHVTTSNDELSKTNTKRKTKIAKRFCTPERRSLRLEALKIESEKNTSETDYNRRLSNGCAHIFFFSLRLRDNNMKHMEDACCCSKEVIYSGKEGIEVNNSLEQNIPHTKNQEQVSVTNDAGNDITESNVDRVEVGGETYNMEQNERQETSNKNDDTDKFIDSYLSAENTASKVPDITAIHIMPVISDTLKKQREVAPLRRSGRSAALIAQENIWRQTASRRRVS